MFKKIKKNLIKIRDIGFLYRYQKIRTFRDIILSRHDSFEARLFRGTTLLRYSFEVRYFRGTIYSRYNLFEIRFIRGTIYSRYSLSRYGAFKVRFGKYLGKYRNYRPLSFTRKIVLFLFPSNFTTLSPINLRFYKSTKNSLDYLIK